MAIGEIGTAFVTGAAGRLGHECVGHHIEDIKKGVDAAKSEVDKGLERDYKAGGIIKALEQKSEAEPA